MSKVKLTKEQAERIEYYKGLGNLKFKCLKDLDAETFARAWIEGYDIKSPFKEGDILLSSLSHTFKEVKEVLDHKIKLTNGLEIDNEDLNFYRHATDNEKIFYELGRKVGEFKVGDRYATKDGIVFYTIRGSHSEVDISRAKKHYKEGKIEHLYPVENRKEFK